MHIAIIASANQQKTILSKPISNIVHISWVNSFTNVVADVYMHLIVTENETNSLTNFENKPVFIHSLTQLSCHLPENFIRVNAWNTFFESNRIEMVFNSLITEKVNKITQLLGWQYIACADTYGMISARIVCMVINEAYFALSEKVSSKQDIDIAMRLGTNYPYGPFEWAEKIGIENIICLLEKLSQESKCYVPSSALLAANN